MSEGTSESVRGFSILVAVETRQPSRKSLTQSIPPQQLEVGSRE